MTTEVLPSPGGTAERLNTLVPNPLSLATSNE
jgi:hypothetical protein